MNLATNTPFDNRRTSKAIKVMIVDDSFVVRGVLKRALQPDNDIEVVAMAVNGQEGVEFLDKYKPDVVILDIEMPVMDGITALPLMLKKNPSLTVIVASTLTLRGADISLKCLELGAKDYLPKPGTTGLIEDPKVFQQELIGRIKSLAGKTFGSFATKESAEPIVIGETRQLLTTQPKAIIIGSSTGGPQALMQVLQAVGNNFQQPIFIAQHMPPIFTKSLANHIEKISGRTAKEGESGEIVKDNTIYIAPGDYHMGVIEENGLYKIITNKEPPENYCRPSVNPLLRSSITAYKGNAVCFMLTGMGSDGLQGAKEFVEKGGSIIAQDQESSTVWGMPKAVYQAGLTCGLVPLNKMKDVIIRTACAKNPRLEVRL